MSDKVYSVEEANELLPHVAPALVELRAKFEEAATIRVAVARAAATNGGSPDREQWSKTLARVTELIERLQRWSIELRDISSGLIDFPAIVEGEEAWLCWRLGEPEIGYWHPKDTGFGSRRPL